MNASNSLMRVYVHCHQLLFSHTIDPCINTFEYGSFSPNVTKRDRAFLLLWAFCLYKNNLCGIRPNNESKVMAGKYAAALLLLLFGREYGLGECQTLQIIFKKTVMDHEQARQMIAFNQIEHTRLCISEIKSRVLSQVYCTGYMSASHFIHA